MAESLSERVAALEDHVQRIEFLTAEVERLSALVSGKVERSDPGYVDPDFTKGVNTNG